MTGLVVEDDDLLGLLALGRSLSRGQLGQRCKQCRESLAIESVAHGFVLGNDLGSHFHEFVGSGLKKPGAEIPFSLPDQLLGLVVAIVELKQLRSIGLGLSLGLSLDAAALLKDLRFPIIRLGLDEDLLLLL